MPILWVWQHQAILNTGSPCISGMRVNSSQATNTDIGLHTFRPYHFRPFSPSSPENQKVYERFDTGCGMLCLSIQCDPTAKDCRDIRQVFVAVKLRVFCIGLWCERSSGSWHSHCDGAAAGRWGLVPIFRYHGGRAKKQALYTLPCILGESCLVVRAGKSFLNFPQAMQNLAAMSLSQPHSPTGFWYTLINIQQFLIWWPGRLFLAHAQDCLCLWCIPWFHGSLLS